MYKSETIQITVQQFSFQNPKTKNATIFKLNKNQTVDEIA